jgi:hypothetical protein
LVREHYDPRYAKVRARREAAVVQFETAALDEPGLDALAGRIESALSSR